MEKKRWLKRAISSRGKSYRQPETREHKTRGREELRSNGALGVEDYEIRTENWEKGSKKDG